MASKAPDRTFYVYVHRRVTDGRIFYVGKGYGYRAWNKCRRSKHWKAVVAKHGLLVEVFRNVASEAEAFQLEREMIASLKADGIPLANKTDGGEGPSGCRHTDETKEKWAAAKRGKKRGPYSPEHRANISRSLIGKPVPADRRARIAIATSVAMRSPEILEKMRMAKLGKRRAPHSQETKDKMRAASLGRPKSAEARANMSAAQKRRFNKEMGCQT